MKLRDGTVIPSFLGVKDRVVEPNENLNNIMLRMGEILEVIKPSEPRSQSKAFNEYIVRLQNKSISGGSNTSEARCFLASTFGGQADRFNYTLRTQKSTGAPSDTGLGLGSKVLVLCINGETNNAVIIGGLREGDKHDKDEGHHLYFEFNGVQVAIQDNGNFVLQMNGPTKADGTPEKEGSKQSTFSFLDDGTCNIEAETGVHIGSASSDEALVMGTTYRQQERSLHLQMLSDFTTLSTLLKSISAMLQVAGSDPVLVLIASVAAASLNTAGITLQGVSGVFDKMYADLYNFESQTDLYLSQKNSTD